MSPAGPVGFQSNNVPLTAGMFTSIGTCAHCSGQSLGLSEMSLGSRVWPGEETLSSWPL